MACLEAGSALVTFPEGTRSKVRDDLDESAESTTRVRTTISYLSHALPACSQDGRLMDFKKGPFTMAARAVRDLGDDLGDYHGTNQSAPASPPHMHASTLSGRARGADHHRRRARFLPGWQRRAARARARRDDRRTPATSAAGK